LLKSKLQHTINILAGNKNSGSKLENKSRTTHINSALQINFSLIMTPSLQVLSYWENDPLRKNTNYNKPGNSGETLCPICPHLPAGTSDSH
jgi:hypothetical protein